MADPREFLLIGAFRDEITPSLQKINESLAKVKSNLESVSKATKPLKTDFRQLASLSDNFAKGLKTQATDIQGVTKAMRAMRNEMGRVNRAYKAGGRNIAQDARKFTTLPPPPPPPRTPRSATPPPPPPPPRTPRYNYNEPPIPMGGPRARGGGSAGGGYAGGGGAGMAAGAFGVTLGSTLGNILTDSIYRGFQIGVGLMAQPFKYAANAISERVSDELSDIQSAGGLFATDKRYGLKLFDDFLQARRTQEDINARLAASAAALPGATSEYVQQAKRITDTMIGALGKQPEAFVKYAETLGAKQGDKLDSLSVVIQKFTEKAVLLGKSPGGGPGGTGRSMYGIPQLLEILVNRDKANIQGMSMKYAAMRDNPLLASALEAAEKKINATAAGSADRLRVIMETLDEALPNEIVAAMKNSVGGFTEAIRSSFFDPEVGLFGLGRKMQLAVPRVNDLGQYIKENGEVAESAALAAKDSASIFGLFRDIMGGFVVPLSELTQILPQIYDPLKAIGIDLIEFRNISQKFFATFNGFTKSFEEIEKKLGGFKTGTAGARGALLTIANLLQNVGKINTKEFQDISKKLQKGDIDLGSVAKDIFGKLFDSKFMTMIGELIGKIVGDVLGIVAQIMSGASDMASAGPFASGLKKGFDAAKGGKSVQIIFEKLFDLIFKAISAIFSAAPLQVTLLAGLVTLGPAIAAAIGTAIVGGIPTFFQKLWSVAGKVLGRTGKVVPVNVTDLGTTSPITDPRRMLPAGKTDPRAAKVPKGFSAFGGKLKGFISLLTSYLDDASSILPGLGGKLKGFVSLLTTYFDDALVAIRNLPSALPNLGGKLKGFLSLLTTYFDDALVAIRNLPSRFTEFAKAPKALPTSAITPAVTKGMSSVGNFFRTFGDYVKGVGPRFTGFFQGFFGKLSIFGAVLTSVISLFQGEDLATSLALGAGPLLGAALGAALIPFLGPIGPMVGASIGSFIGSLDAVTVPLTEIFRSVGGAFQGLGDIVGMIVTLTGDLLGTIADLVVGIFGIKGEFDWLRIALAPFTLALQAVEVGLKGFALLLAEARVFFTRYFGSSEEYQGAIKERDRMNASMRESQGRINAYNDSMQGTAKLQKGVNDAQYELINGGKKLNEARKKELVAFIEAAQKLNKKITTKVGDPVKAKASPTTKDVSPASPPPPVTYDWWGKLSGNVTKGWNQMITDLSGLWGRFESWFTQGLTNAWNQSVNNLSGLWNKVGSWFTQGFTNAWNQLSAWVVSLSGTLQAGVSVALAGMQNAWNSLVNGVTSLGVKLGNAVSISLAGTQNAWNGLVNWITGLGIKFGNAVSTALAGTQNAWVRLANWVANSGVKIGNAVSTALVGMQNAWNQLSAWVLSLPGKVQASVSVALAGMQNAWNNLVNWVSGLGVKLGNATSAALVGMQSAWNNLVNWVTNLGVYFGSAISTALAGMQSAWDRLVTWITSLGVYFGSAISTALVGMQNAWNRLVGWITSLGAKLGAVVSTALAGLQNAWSRLVGWVSSLGVKLGAAVTSALSSLNGFVGMLGDGIRTWLTNSVKNAIAGWRAGAPNPPSTPAPAAKVQTVKSKAFGSPGASFSNLEAAVSYEQKHKPAGSDLVVANSSETVIPAAGGYGMEAFIETMRAGFNSVVQTYAQVQQKQESSLNYEFSGIKQSYASSTQQQLNSLNKVNSTLVTNQQQTNTRLFSSTQQQLNSLNKINFTLVTNQQQTNKRLSALETKFTSPSMGGLGGGSIGGGVDAFTPMAQQMGLQMTSGYRPGDPGWHGANRARDFSNGTGPTPQMMQFAQMLASKYGSNLKELIYTPLGFSIKNGQRVAPYAQGAHYNHVHVAYANGIGQGVAFNSLKGAQDWESSMVRGSVKVGSVTANSGEGFGGSPVNVTNNISISQQPGQSVDELASIVAMKIGEAVADARSASIFV